MRVEELRPLWERGTGWWDARSGREQLLLGALAALALVAVLLLAVIRPLEGKREAAIAAIGRYEGIAARLRGGAAPASPLRRGPPAAVVAQAAAAAGLAVRRIEPRGDRLDVVLGDAAYGSVLGFVSDIEARSALRVAEARIERSQLGGGQVSAQFVLAGG